MFNLRRKERKGWKWQGLSVENWFQSFSAIVKEGLLSIKKFLFCFFQKSSMSSFLK
jgi:hypothetical protein